MHCSNIEMWLIIRKEQRKLELKKTRRKWRTKKQVLKKKINPRIIVVKKQVPKEPNQSSSATLEFESLITFSEKILGRKMFSFQRLLASFYTTLAWTVFIFKMAFLGLFFLASFIVSFLIMKQNFFSPPCFM